MPFLVAPHRGYASAKRPFNARLVDDWIVAPLAAISAELLETRKPDLVLGSLCLSDHVDHYVVLEAIRQSFADHAVLPWEDWSYADREDRVAAIPAVIEHLTPETRAPRVAACAAYRSQRGFQFGGVEAVIERTERTERIFEERFYPLQAF